VDDRFNDPNAAQAAIGPEPYGQAALLLVQSLIHRPIACSALTVPQAVEIVQIAADVKQDTGCDGGDSPATLQQSLRLLNSISASLMHDLPRTGTDGKGER
jgi:hypothetical protein